MSISISSNTQNIITTNNNNIIIINRNENNNFLNFKFENMKIVTIIQCNKGAIYCLKTLEDGRLAAGDSKSNLIIYNMETFKPEVIIKNNLEESSSLFSL